MPFDYFSKLPITQYPLSKEKTKETRDILHRLYIDQKFSDSSEYIRKYEVNDGDRPETISDKLYGRSDLHSVIMVLNNGEDSIIGGVPVSSVIRDEYIENKYEDKVYYLYPSIASLTDLTDSTITGGSGGYVYPMFGYGFNVGDKIFQLDSEGFPNIETRGYVKEWDPEMMSVKLDVLSGIFSEGMTIGLPDASVSFVVGTIKEGRNAVHHFEAIKDVRTTTGYSSITPINKGTRISPLNQVFISGSILALIPLGTTSSVGGTASYTETLVYRHNKFGSISVAMDIDNYVKTVTQSDYENELQERKRFINVPSPEQNTLTDLINRVDDLLEGTNP